MICAVAISYVNAVFVATIHRLGGAIEPQGIEGHMDGVKRVYVENYLLSITGSRW